MRSMICLGVALAMGLLFSENVSAQQCMNGRCSLQAQAAPAVWNTIYENQTIVYHNTAPAPVCNGTNCTIPSGVKVVNAMPTVSSPAGTPKASVSYDTSFTSADGRLMVFERLGSNGIPHYRDAGSAVAERVLSAAPAPVKTYCNGNFCYRQ